MASSTSSSSPPAPTTADNIKAGIQRWALAAVAAVAAESATFPIDFTKTRLQLQNEMGRTLKGDIATSQLGMVATFRQIITSEGLLAMYGGLPASALRQAVYGGIGVGLYAPVRQLIIGDMDPKDAPLYLRMLAGEGLRVFQASGKRCSTHGSCSEWYSLPYVIQVQSLVVLAKRLLLRQTS